MDEWILDISRSGGDESGGEETDETRLLSRAVTEPNLTESPPHAGEGNTWTRAQSRSEE